MRQLFSLLTMAVLLFPHGALAATVLIGDKINVEADEVIEGDYYVSVGSLGTTVMSGTVEGDMYALAGSVTANGVIMGDFGSIGGLAYMNASTSDDVRIVAGEAVIDDYVGGDLLVIAGVLKVLSTAHIEGDVIFYGVEGEINGEVGGSVYGTAQTLRIDSNVGGDVDVNAPQELTLGSKAAIAGSVRYESLSELVRAQESVVDGDIQRRDAEDATTEAVDWRALLIPLFVSLFATLTLYILFKKEMYRIVDTILRSPLPAGLIGLLTLIVGPFVSLLLITTVLGMLLGIFGVGAMLLLGAVGFSLAIVFTGALIAKFVVGAPKISLGWILLGAVTFHALFFVPIVGPTIVLCLLALTIGGSVLALYRVLI